MNNTTSLRDLPAFYWVAKTSSISQAADKLNLSKATVSKTISRLEEHYQTRLFERNSRNVRLTSEGYKLLEYAERVMTLADEADHALFGMKSSPQGSVQLAAPLAFCREVLAPNLIHFHTSYPAIKLHIQTSAHPMDVLRDDIDMAVIVGNMDHSELIAKSLYKGSLKWVSTPGYLANMPVCGTPKDLEPHIQYCESRYSVNKLPVYLDDRVYYLSLQAKNCCNDPLVVREAVLRGYGICMLPAQYCAEHLEDGKLVEIYSDFKLDAQAAQLSLVYPSRLYRSNRIQAVSNFLQEICQSL